MLNPKFYAAFAWALLGSIVNITSRPPKFKPLKHVECITKVDNENVRPQRLGYSCNNVDLTGYSN